MSLNKQITNTYSDSELVAKYLRTQDMSYFDEIFLRYSNKVYYKAYSMLGDLAEAEDATQDVFLKVLLKLTKFTGQSKFSTWIYSITYNHCIDQIRRLNKERMIFSDAEESHEVGEETNELLVEELKIAALQSTLEIIDEADRTILLMKYTDNLMISEIADILKLSESAAKMRLLRAKHKFKDIYTSVLRI